MTCTHALWLQVECAGIHYKGIVAKAVRLPRFQEICQIVNAPSRAAHTLLRNAVAYCQQNENEDL